MAVIKVEVKNQLALKSKPRVYFTGHPDDFEKCFRKVCDDIFATQDCAIYYTEDMTEAIAPEDRATDLGRNNLFVVPVTYRLLSTPNRAMDEDIPYAKQEHIPILPIMMDSGIDFLYSKPDKFGELQYLNPYSTDRTEISYEEKLKKYLSSVLVSDEMAQKIRAAFDAYIFLSYRKKDRRYANELMRLIHSNRECRNIAIWFDEFLIPGESFKEKIEKILDDCKLFALLVTPSLLEKVLNEEGQERENFVVSTELPIARQKKAEKGTEILAVEMEQTDRAQLQKLQIEVSLNMAEAHSRERLLDTIKKLATTKNETPEHNFLIGLAYLDGIDVEVNREQAIELITQAAENGLPEAMQKLYRMYDEGAGVALDYRKAVIWAERYAEHMRTNFGEEHPNTLAALNDLASTYSDLGQYEKALQTNEKVYALRCKALGEKHPDTLTSLDGLGANYAALGKHEKAQEIAAQVYALSCKVCGAEHPDTLISLNNLAEAYFKYGKYEKAAALFWEVYLLRCKVLGEEHPDALTALNNIAETDRSLGKHEQALELKEKAYALRCKVLGAEHPDTLTSLNNLSLTYSDLGKHKKALELKQSAYALRCKVLGAEHPHTLNSLNNLASTYSDLGAHEKALELKTKGYALRYKVSGEMHPATLASLNNLAETYYALAMYEKALELLKKAYLLRCEVLGERHSETLTSLSNLAETYRNLKDYEKALELNEKAYALRCKVLGAEHTDTLTSLNNLALTYAALEKYEKALEVEQKVYELRYKVLGAEHPHTLNSLSNLAFFLKTMGDYASALPLYEKLCLIWEAALGAEHPKTQQARTRLAEVRAKLI